jgi:arsenate reductase
MALGFFRDLAEDRAGPVGADPGDEINPAAIAAMRGHGIDLSGEFPKPWTDQIIHAADVVVTMGYGEACPVLPASATATGTSMTPPG